MRDAIGSGATGDKVDFPDPDAATLGTDEEAGGPSPTPSERAAALRQELRQSAVRGDRNGCWKLSLPDGGMANDLRRMYRLVVIAWALWMG